MNFFRDFLRNQLTPQQLRSLKDIYCPLFASNDLQKLSDIYGSDKGGGHHYVSHYETHFKSRKNQKLNILEIGVGGDDKPKSGGASLGMWRAYFPNSLIYGIDIYDKTYQDRDRIKTFLGSQIDLEFLERVVQEIGCIDIIIDDGSHINNHVIETFNYLFPRLSDGGIYVIEDVQTSYWPKFGGSPSNFNSIDTIMGFFKNLTDGLNYSEYSLPDRIPTYFEKHIVALHFYHNLIFIYKGNNDEKSNLKANALASLLKERA